MELSEEGPCSGLGEGCSRRMRNITEALGMVEEEGNEAEPSREVGRVRSHRGLGPL